MTTTSTITSNLTELGTAQPQLVSTFCDIFFYWSLTITPETSPITTFKSNNTFNSKKNNNNKSQSLMSELDQVLKLGFLINNNNKTKTMKTTTKIYQLFFTKF